MQRIGKLIISISMIISFDLYLIQADHHPYCHTSCSGFKVRSSRTSCLMSCDQDLSGLFYRAGRLSYLGLLPATFADGDRDEGADAIEFPGVDDVVLREPRDRSAFVRIGKRDVSSVLAAKRRDEFVRIGKAAAAQRQVNRFLLGRSYVRPIGENERQLVDPIAVEKASSSSTDNRGGGGGGGGGVGGILLPISDTIKRPSAFVRIGKSSSLRGGGGDQVDEGPLAPSSVDAYTNGGGGGDEVLPGAADDSGEAAMDKKASAFVRIGRKKGAAFVRIGKSEPSMKKK